MGPVQVFVFLAAISGVLGSDDFLKLKPWIPTLEDAVDSMDLPALESTEQHSFIMKPINESLQYHGTIVPIRNNMEKKATLCGSYTLYPGQSVDIQSKNFPGNYPKNDACTWTFEVSSSSSKISIKCKPFILKNCKLSSVVITGRNLKKKFCGKKKKGIMASSSNNQMKVVFKSKKKTSKGFKCTVTASGSAPPSGCKKCGTINVGTRIINGVELQVNAFPWQAGLVVAGTNTLFCGGVLYNDLFVLTAAHCVKVILDNNLNVDVLLGAHDLNNPTSTLQRIPMLYPYYHGLYNKTTLDNDIGLLELARPATLNDYVKPACLPTPKKDYSGYIAFVSGWGLTEDGQLSSVLLEASLRILSNSDCKTYYWSQVTGNMICLISTTYSQTACEGDSGGALVVYDNGEWVVVGVSSFGWKGCPTNYATVYARVSPYLELLANTAARGQNNLCPMK